MADWQAEGKFYMTTITEVHSDDTVDVEYEYPYDDVEKHVDLARIRSVGKSVTKAVVMRALRRTGLLAGADDPSGERHIGPQPHYRARNRKGTHML